MLRIYGEANRQEKLVMKKRRFGLLLELQASFEVKKSMYCNGLSLQLNKKWLALRCSKCFSGLPLQLISPMRGLLRPCLPKGNHVRPCLTKGNHAFSFRPYLTKANKKDKSQKPGEDRRDSYRISIKDHHKRCDEQTLHSHPIVLA